MRFRRPILMALVLAGCGSGADDAPARGVPRDTAPASAALARDSAPVSAGRLPPIGLAVSDSTRAWCAEFTADSSAPQPEPGRRVAIVFAGPAAVPAQRARIAGRRTDECPAAFPQPRWFGYAAYRLELIDSLPAAAQAPTVALVVAGEARWTRGADGLPRADLDGDGQEEEARRCTADEGEHFTIWSTRRAGGTVRRWHEYFDWGALTDPTCRPGEDGLDPTTSPPAPESP